MGHERRRFILAFEVGGGFFNPGGDHRFFFKAFDQSLENASGVTSGDFFNRLAEEVIQLGV